MQSESLSEGSSESDNTRQMFGGTGRNSEKRSDLSQLRDDQDCKSIDSHMSALRMPKYLRNLDYLALYKESNADETSRQEQVTGKATPNDASSVSNQRGDSIKSIQLQMQLFNMSVCYARCGYIESAIKCIGLPKLQELQLFQQLNTIIYQMIQLPIPYKKNHNQALKRKNVDLQETNQNSNSHDAIMIYESNASE